MIEQDRNARPGRLPLDPRPFVRLSELDLAGAQPIRQPDDDLLLTLDKPNQVGLATGARCKLTALLNRDISARTIRLAAVLALAIRMNAVDKARWGGDPFGT